METTLYQNHLAILEEELQVAMGCTEPIAIAFAAAKARQVLGRMPEHCSVKCSGNIVKNVKGVTVPTSGGLRGIEIAALLGLTGGDADKELAVLTAVTPETRDEARRLMGSGLCSCELIEGVANLYIVVEVAAGDENALVEVVNHHNNITRIEKNGKTLLKKDAQQEAAAESACDRSLLNLKNILQFADEADPADLAPVLNRQIEYNSKISAEGLTGKWGAAVGCTLLERQNPPSLELKARAWAAAGSDARMAGCSLPVVINSGSGNQGITITMPVVVYAEALGASEEQRLRALALANLISVHQKKYIGSLSAYCGAVSAATGAACGVAYLKLKGKISEEALYQVMSDTITNSICTIGGMVCDGAKSSCAAKIAAALESAFTGLEMSLKQRVFQPGEGLTMDSVEDTIAAVGRMGRVGMKSTDVEILNIMLGH